MNESMPIGSKAPVLNPESVRRLQDLAVPGEPNPLVELIDLYLADAPRCLDRLRQAIELLEKESVHRISHSLRGSSTNLGAERLASSCCELERLSRDGDLSSAPKMFAVIEREFKAAADALERERAAALAAGTELP